MSCFLSAILLFCETHIIAYLYPAGPCIYYDKLLQKKQSYPIFARHIRDAMQATILQKLKTTCHEVFGWDTPWRKSNISGISVGQHSKVCVNKCKMFSKQYKYVYIYIFMCFYSCVFIKSVYVHVSVCGFDLKAQPLFSTQTVRPKGMALQPQELRWCRSWDCSQILNRTMSQEGINIENVSSHPLFT